MRASRTVGRHARWGRSRMSPVRRVPLLFACSIALVLGLLTPAGAATGRAAPGCDARMPSASAIGCANDRAGRASFQRLVWTGLAGEHLAALGSRVPCAGDGVTGDRVQVIYARPARVARP